MRALLLPLALVACAKSENPWIDTHATQLHVGTLEADIPAGWRDINELADQSKVPKMMPGMRSIMPENVREHGMVSVFPVPAAIKGDDCASLGTLIESQDPGKVEISNAEGAQFDGKPGCMMTMRREGHIVKLRFLTPPGGSTVGVQCFGSAKDLDTACDKIVYGLHVTPTK